MAQRIIDKRLAGVEVEKADSKGERITSGLMTVGSVDSDQEIVDQRSALAAMPAFKEAGMPVQYNHDSGGNIGRGIDYLAVRRADSRDSGPQWVPADETTVEAIKVWTLYGQGYQVPTLFHGLVPVDDIWSQIAQKMLRTHSIRFLGGPQDPVDVNAGAVPRLDVERILEYSVVTIPSQREATMAVQLAKAAGFGRCTECTDQLATRLAEWEDRVGQAQGRAIIEAARARVSDVSRLAHNLHDLAHALREG